MDFLLILIIAFSIDFLISDPDWLPHPVVLIGKTISYLEKYLRNPKANPFWQKLKGGILVLIILGLSFFSSKLLIAFAGRIDKHFAYLLKLILLSLCLALKGLVNAGQEVYAALAVGDLDLARSRVNMIVGRDCSQNNKEDVIRAVLETLAENTSDGILAPAFYYLLGGVPLALTYKAVNTMDSMLGYKNDKYLNFGYAAAKTDDLFNYIPARITAFVMTIAAFILQYDFKAACTFIFRDASKHPSPNAGYPEAAAAGALGLRFGGYNYYHGQKSFRAYIGEAKKNFKKEDILSLNKIIYTATILFLLITVLISFLVF